MSDGAGCWRRAEHGELAAFSLVGRRLLDQGKRPRTVVLTKAKLGSAARLPAVERARWTTDGVLNSAAHEAAERARENTRAHGWWRWVRSIAGLAATVGTLVGASADGKPKPRSCGRDCVEWRIDRPPISVSEITRTAYPDVEFQAGDVVTVQAGGCARKAKGEPGAPMVQYLNLAGNERLETPGAIIYIPGVTPGFASLNDFVNRRLVIPEAVDLSNDCALWLGFAPGEDTRHPSAFVCSAEDVAAGDNYVIVTIRRGGVGRPSARRRPLDLRWLSLDYNGLPFNPYWTGQQGTPGTRLSPCVLGRCAPSITGGRLVLGWGCTNQTTYSDLAGHQAVECFIAGRDLGPPGHVNWGPSTFEGEIAFDSFDPGDRDYNFELTPKHGEALFRGRQTLHLEFNEDDIPALEVPFWKQLERRAVTLQNNKLASQFVGHRRAIATGVLGLDCRHLDSNRECKVELHPVYGLAIQLPQKGTAERWAVMVRNWGGEGECSSRRHLLYATRLAFFLRGSGNPGFTATVATQRVSQRRGHPIVERKHIYRIADGAVVVYELPPPQEGVYVEDELLVRWDLRDSRNWPAGSAEPPLLRTAPDAEARVRAFCADPRKAANHPDGCMSGARPTPKPAIRRRGGRGEN